MGRRLTDSLDALAAWAERSAEEQRQRDEERLGARIERKAETIAPRAGDAVLGPLVTADGGLVASVRGHLLAHESIVGAIYGGERMRLVATDLRVLVVAPQFLSPRVWAIPFATISRVAVEWFRRWPDEDVWGRAPQRFEEMITVVPADDAPKVKRAFIPVPIRHAPVARAAANTLQVLVQSRHRDIRRAGSVSADFECPQCGRWTQTSDAIDERQKAMQSLPYPMPVLDGLQEMADGEPLRPARLQQELGMEFEYASSLLDAACRVQLLARKRSGAVRAPLVCGPCYAAASAPPKPVVERKSVLRSGIPPQLRFRVLQRDGFRCQYCGRSQQGGAVLHLDHVVPFSKGGETSEGNLITACDECNLGKSASELV